MQSNILPVIHLLEEVNMYLKCTVKTRILHHQLFQIVKKFSSKLMSIYVDEEQITLNDLKELMDSFPKDSLHEAFITKWIKHKFQEQLKGEIVITEINGKLNVVTF